VIQILVNSLQDDGSVIHSVAAGELAESIR